MKMADLFKVFGVFIGFIGISALCEWIADNASRVIWALIPVTLYIAFIVTFGNQFRKEDKE